MPRVNRHSAVLIVDDNEANLLALEAVLSALDVEIVRARSGDEALKQLIARRFAVVLMDVQMPELDGFQTAELIRQRNRTHDTPIIFVTAIFTDDRSAKRGYSLGALDYLTKPLDDDMLRAKVSALLSHYRQADLIERQARALRCKEEESHRQREALEIAEASNRAKDAVLGVVSHELRAPLNAIMGWAALLRNEANLSPLGTKAAEALLHNVQTQSKLVEDLIDLSQMAMRTLKIEHVPVDVAQAIQSAIATMQPSALDSRVRVELNVAPGPYEIMGERRRLEQLFCSLLSNAIKFSSPDAAVNVDLFCNDGAIRLRVKDGGVGIAPELLPHIFDAFRQSDSSWTRRHGGFGVGLTMARYVAELHGGTLEASSAGEGRGAELMLTLPLTERASAAAPQRDATASPGSEAAIASEVAMGDRPLRDLRILIVDDDHDVRELLPMIVSEAGASVADGRLSERGRRALRGRNLRHPSERPRHARRGWFVTRAADTPVGFGTRRIAEGRRAFRLRQRR